MSYARKHLAAIEGYRPGEQPAEGGFIKLNTNENPYPPSPRVFEAIKGVAGENMRKYPDAVFRRLRSRISETYGVGKERIFVGNGSDEVLSLLVRTFVDPDEKVVYTYPSYVLYETLAQLNAVGYKAVELDENFDLPEEVFRAKGKLFFLANPNSPTGKCVPVDMIGKLCRSFPGLVIADEAYVDFSQSSCLPLLKECANLVILRTFSKSFSLASIRVGFALASERNVADLMKMKDSYNVNHLSQLAAEAALEDIEHMRANVRKIVRTRSRLSRELEALGFVVYPSESNFVLARYPDGTACPLYEELKRRKILVRYFPLRRLEDCLRITVGTDEEINALLKELGSILKK
ncbi:MAG: histidinol-phosphate transaminase [Candidatus Lindowbacteria bacterium]|nr:histidinol-phosphate transaminase [Candidatus Lindowbacteria bacterium]